jgi:hypothetical protein
MPWHPQAIEQRAHDELDTQPERPKEGVQKRSHGGETPEGPVGKMWVEEEPKGILETVQHTPSEPIAYEGDLKVRAASRRFRQEPICKRIRNWQNSPIASHVRQDDLRHASVQQAPGQR